MALKARISKLDDVKEIERPFYKASGSEYVLDVDGMVPEEELTEVNTKIAEFRDNNVRLARENDSLKAKYKDVDPEKYRTLQTEVESLKRKTPDTTAVEVQIKQAVDAAVEPIQTQLKQQAEARAQAEQKYQDKLLEDKLWEVGVKAGVKENMRKHWLSEAKPFFKLEAEQLVGVKRDHDGKEVPLYSARRGKAAERMTAEEWATEIAPVDPTISEFYKGSSGGGARNDGKQVPSTDQSGRRVLPDDPTVLSQNVADIASGKAVPASALR